jgi:hypothetical protein
MSKLAGNTRAALLGVLFAMVGFSFAIASFDGGSSGASAKGRAVGSNPLHFTNPFFTATTDRDLGDIVAGSGFVRYVRAAGGVAPYTFTSSVNPTLKSVISTADILKNGTVIGTTAASFNTTPVRFNVTVADSSTSNASKTEFFRLTLVSGSAFRFAVDAIPTATQLRDYITKIEVLNGTPVSFTAAILSSTVAGVGVGGKLEDVGLTLANDGTLYGKPTKSGSITFACIAKDAKGTNALGRFPAVTAGQDFTLNIEANNTVAADIFATGITIKGGQAGKDSVSYKGIANLGATAVSSLAGATMTLRIGKYVTPGNAATVNTLDAKGKIGKSPKPAKGVTVVTLKGGVSSKGQVTLTAGKETLGTLFDGSDTYTVNIQVGPINATEVLVFTRKTSSKGFSLTYKQGTNVNVAGGFLLTKVDGKDDAKAATDFDSWKVALLAQVPAASSGSNLTAGSFDGANAAVVSIGNSFTDDVGVSAAKGTVKSTDKKKPTDAEVLKLQLSNKGKGSVQTGFLPATATGIKAAKSGATGANFALGVVLKQGTNVTFSGEGGAPLFNKSNKSWTSANPTK